MRKADNHPVPFSRNLGALTSWKPLGLSRPVMGLLYLYLFFIPLKSANQHFTLYKLIVMPQGVFKDKFTKYLPEFSHFGLSVSRQDYILLTSADLMHCTTVRFTVCPINTALYDVQSFTCEAILFFQTTGNYSP